MASKQEWYGKVIAFLSSIKGRSAYTSTIQEHIGKDQEWTQSLLAEMRAADLIFYQANWGWRIRKGAQERLGAM